jgi:hypothetical protein
MIYSQEFNSSSVLAGASYDEDTSELTITFLNGRSYTYKDVLFNTYQDLVNAPSPGKYYAQIKKDLVLK